MRKCSWPIFELGIALLLGAVTLTFAENPQKKIPPGTNSDPEILTIERLIDRLILPHSSEEPEIIDKIAAYGTRATPSLIKALENIIKQKEFSITAVDCNDVARVLGKIKDKRAVKPLLKIVSLKTRTWDGKEDDHYCKNAAIEALGDIGDSSAVDAILAELSKGQTVHTATALAKIGDNRAIYPLIASLHADRYVDIINSDVYKALITFGTSAIDASVGSLKSDKAQTKSNAIEFLLIYDTSNHLGLIKPLLRDPAAIVRVSALKYLAKFANHDEISRLALPLARDKDSEVRFTAADLLYKIGDSRAVDVLVTELISRFPAAKETHIKESIATQLGDLQDVRAIPVLEKELCNWSIRQSVGKALTKLNYKPGSAANTIHYYVAVGDQKKLTENWEDTKSVLLSDIKSGNKLKVENALYAFVAIGKYEILPDLVNLLESHGTVAIATAYLNCGNAQLERSAREWAKKRGYGIAPYGAAGSVSWGRF